MSGRGSKRGRGNRGRGRRGAYNRNAAKENTDPDRRGTKRRPESDYTEAEKRQKTREEEIYTKEYERTGGLIFHRELIAIEDEDFIRWENAMLNAACTAGVTLHRNAGGRAIRVRGGVIPRDAIPQELAYIPW
eukprot:sb/3474885/